MVMMGDNSRLTAVKATFYHSSTFFMASADKMEKILSQKIVREMHWNSHFDSWDSYSQTVISILIVENTSNQTRRIVRNSLTGVALIYL